MVPSKPTVKTKPDYVKEFAPFLVPRDDGKSKTRFLVCKFSAVSKDAGLGKEMDQKMISLRDAMYYYLRSKSNEYLMDPAQWTGHQAGSGLRAERLSDAWQD